MLPEDDDGSEMGGGPPPDPSMRVWRHPSEIAAAAAAAARPPTPQAERPLRMLLGTIGGTAVGVVSLVGLALYLAGSGGRGSTVAIEDRPLDEPAGSMAAAIVGSPDHPSENDLRQRAESDGEGIADGEARESRSRADVDPNAEQTATTVPAPTLEVPEEAEINESEPGALLDPGLRPPPEEQLDGVFALHETMLGRVGGYVAVNGLIFTSASTLDGKERVALLANDIWVEASVRGVDRITDVAVLTVDNPTEDQGFLEAAAMTAIDESGAILAIPGNEIRLQMPGVGRSETLTGLVLSDQKETTAHDGTSIYGTLQTSMVQPDGSPGSAVYNDAENLVVGMIINSPEYLTTAISIDRVLAVGHWFIERGVPAIEWLGITGTNLTTGGVALTAVDENGPAAESGLQVDDVILAFGETDVGNLDHLVYLIREAGVDTVVTIYFMRDEETSAVEATVGALPPGTSPGS